MQEKERAFGGQERELLRQSVRDSTGERTTELSTNNVRGILLSHVERGGAGEASPSDCRDQPQSDQSKSLHQHSKMSRVRE